MRFFARLSNGWTLSMNSFKVLKENKQLILLPVLSGISMVFILGSFITLVLGTAGWDVERIKDPGPTANSLYIFLFYLVNYFVVVFFNTALIHCSRLYFKGEEVTISKGLQFSMSRIGAVLSWSLFAATVGTVLRLIEENAGWIGRLILSLIGIVWSVATFFVVPVIAYENAGPFNALKRSAQIMKDKWGESLGATFSFGLVKFVASLLVALPLFIIGMLVHVMAGVVLAVLGLLLVTAVISASETIFISAVYHNIQGDPVKHINQQLVDHLFEPKNK